jgi:bifunctional UDP-N-acetylglucosamine pyrophosphorylase/glucosamine-1-phosphate N-acetyltransferase
MQCVILAAGEGKRMRPLTASRPKVMLPVANRPILEHLIAAAVRAGFTRFVLVIGYGEREIRDHFGDGSALGCRIRYVTQRKQLGTGDAVRACAGLVSGPFLLMNGDMIVGAEDIAAIAAMDGPVMGIYRTDHPQDFGVVTCEDGYITGLEEKSPEPRSDLINAGVYRFDEEIFGLIDRIGVSSRGEYELTDALTEYVRERRLRSRMLDVWLDMGYPWDLLDANSRLLLSLAPLVEGDVEEGVVMKGAVSIGKGTVVMSGTYIEGPCVIGRGCKIGPHAYLRPATAIGDRCHIGHSSEIKNSIVLPDTKIPHFNYIGDSVIGSLCNFGAGSKVANLRNDGATVKVAGRNTGRRKLGAIVGDRVSLGINCSVNVGTVIGPDVKIAPHSFVEGWIEEGTSFQS